jgi:hypothetical protein
MEFDQSPTVELLHDFLRPLVRIVGEEPPERIAVGCGERSDLIRRRIQDT